MSWLYFAGHSTSHGPFSQDESFLIALLAKACTGAPGVLATAGWTWLSIRQSSVRNAVGGSAMISNSGRPQSFRREIQRAGLIFFGEFLRKGLSQKSGSRRALLAEILTFGRAPRGGTRRKLLSLPVGFLAENFVACQPNSSPKELLIIADPPPAFLTELCLIDSQVHPAVASTPGAPVHALASKRNQETHPAKTAHGILNGRQSKAMTYTAKSRFDQTTNLAKQPS